MLTKECVIGIIEVTASGHLQVREDTRIMEDGEELSVSYHRYCLAPGDDLTGHDAKVTAVAQAVWTPDVVAAYRAGQEAVLVGQD